MDAREAPDFTTKVLGVVLSLALLAASVMLAMLATEAFGRERTASGVGFAIATLACFVASELVRRRAL